jgi:hypothetical protein
MARGVSVKVSTVKVIKALEAKLEAGTKAITNNEKKRKEYEKTQKAWAKEVAELAFKQIAKGEVHASENWRGETNVTIQLPAGAIKLPELVSIELEQELGRYEIQEIENAIRILKMTDEEFVNATTFNKLAQYL